MKSSSLLIDKTREKIKKDQSGYKTSLKASLQFLLNLKEIEQNYLNDLNMLRVTGGRQSLLTTKTL